MGRMNHVNSKDEVLEAFRVFDQQNTGSIGTDQLRQILSELGDPMDANEIEELLYEADPHSSGYVSYQQFVDNMFLYD